MNGSTRPLIHMFYVTVPAGASYRLNMAICTFVILASLLLSACSEPLSHGRERTFGSTVDPLDHDPSDTFVRKVYINDRWVGSARSGGSGVSGGISLPERWRPGLTAHVRWERCKPYAQSCVWHELDAAIHEYDEVGMTWVHIMPGDKEVLIIPSMVAPGYPDYPGPDYPDKDFFKDTRK